MRLLRLYVHEHRVLKKLDIDFEFAGEHGRHETDSTSFFKRNFHLDFLVGVNGTGKSTVLRLLGRIFRQSFAELRDLPFILEYYREKDDQKIRIANIHPHEKTPLESFSITVVNGLNGDLDEQPEEYADYLSDSLFPERIIAYTTGSETEWFNQEDINPFDQSNLTIIQSLTPEERTIRELPGWSLAEKEENPAKKEEKQSEAIPRFRFVWQEQLPLVALAGFLLHSTTTAESPLTKVLRTLDGNHENDQERQANGIAKDYKQYLAGFSLQFDLAHSISQEHNDILQVFGQHASRSIRTGGTLLLVFQPDRFNVVLKESGGALKFFERLADWQRREMPLLVKVNLFLERTPKEKDEEDNPIHPPLHTWNWLSDGERSFIGRICLFMLFGEVESLILLDEPEVHFNDFWKRHIVSMMSKVFDNKADKSHVLISTHSSISLSDVPSDDVIILKRPGLQTSETKQIDIQTFGADPSDIMVHVFDAPHAMGEYSVEEIDRWLDDAGKKSDKERKKYLSDRLEKVSPGYWAYRIRREMVGLQA